MDLPGRATVPINNPSQLGGRNMTPLGFPYAPFVCISYHCFTFKLVPSSVLVCYLPQIINSKRPGPTAAEKHPPECLQVRLGRDPCNCVILLSYPVSYPRDLKSFTNSPKMTGPSLTVPFAQHVPHLLFWISDP